MKKSSGGWVWFIFGLALGAVLLAACGAAAPTAAPTAASQPAAQEPTSVVITQEVEKPVVTSMPAPTATPAALATLSPAATPSPLPTTSPPATPVARVEERLVELEWPERMRLGDSDVVRLALVPSAEGYRVRAEFEEHPVESEPVEVPRPGGYDLAAVARLSGVGFVIDPAGPQEQWVPPGEPVTWRWTLTPRNAGRQRLTIQLSLRWTPSGQSSGGGAAAPREVTAFSKPIEVQVISFLGLSQAQALATGLFGLLFGGSLSLFALVVRPRGPRPALVSAAPNPTLAIELRPGLELAPDERAVLQSLFRRYGRLVIEKEFLSGYSGARTFLALPLRTDGRADAYTIAKLGERSAIAAEFHNYERFVKDTLPPITARIQHPPVTLPSPPGRPRPRLERAALQYTFIAAPGSTPASLRSVLLADPDPAPLFKLFSTFGPNWWMQRRAYTFRLAQEYDGLLPTHLVLQPVDARGPVLDGRSAPAGLQAEPGQVFTLRNFNRGELRADGQSLSLLGEGAAGQPRLRVRWLSPHPPGLGGEPACGQVVATRHTLLAGFTAGFDLCGLPDPLLRLPGLLEEMVSGTQSTIHGDLNLENVLAGPGGFVWLIDFAQTREGHPLSDFAHLQAQIIAHVVAPQVESAEDFLAILAGSPPAHYAPLQTLLAALPAIAARCLFNPDRPREYQLALTLACLGALKHANLGAHARRLLYLAAAHTAAGL